MKRSPLQRRTPLQGGAPLQRRSRLRPVSDKRRAVQRLRRDLVERVLASRPRCEVGDIIRGMDRIHPCHVWATDVHEPLTRARGGSILDEENTLSVCRSCHDWIHHHPSEAQMLGLLRSQYERRDD